MSNVFLCKQKLRCFLPALLVALLLQGVHLACTVKNNPYELCQTETAYVQLAEVLLHNHVFADVAEGGVLVPHVARTPGYPLFIAAIWFFSGTSQVALICVQSILGLVCVYLVYLLAGRLWSDLRIASIASILYALSFTRIEYLHRDWSVTLMMFFLLLSLLFLFQFLKNPLSRLPVFFCGTMMALGIIVRPAMYYLPLVILCCVLWGTLRAPYEHMRKHLANCVTVTIFFILPFAVILGGWVYRNYRETGLAEVTSYRGSNLYGYLAGHVLADHLGIPFKSETVFPDARYYLNQRLIELGAQNMSLPEQHALWLREGKKIIMAYPVDLAKGFVRGMALMLTQRCVSPLVFLTTYAPEQKQHACKLIDETPSGGSPALMLKRQQALWHAGYMRLVINFVLNVSWHIVVYGGVLLALFRHFEVSARFGVLVLVFGYFWAIPGPFGYARYSAPLDPFLAIFAAVGLVGLFLDRSEVKREQE